MRIPRQFHQFNNEKALLIVSGNEAVDLYFAENGQTKLILRYREAIPHYSDREEFFIQSGPGKRNQIGSGSTYESKEDEVERRLQNYLKKEVNEILKQEKISTIYLLAPDFYLKRAATTIPNNAQEKIRLKIPENLAGKNEIDVIKVVNKYFEKTLGQSVPRDKATNKLLKETDEIRKKIGKKKA